MSAQIIYDHVPLGSLVCYSDGMLRPPEQFKRKLAAWENSNNGGRLVRKVAARTVGTYTMPASITLHQGNFGSAGVVVLKVFKTFSVDTPLTFTVVERPKPGMVRVLDHAGEGAELLHFADDCAAAEAWLATHRYPGAVLDEVTDYEAAPGARTHDDLLVAKVGDNAFAMMPSAHGRFYLASAWRLHGPMEQWTRSDFYSHGGELDDEATFRARVHENAEHQRQRAALGRRKIRAGANTPWGSSQGATIYANGVVCHSTAGHGGFHLDAAHNAKIHPALRARDGWYEEDCAWAAVAQAFPDLFTDYERRCADRTIRDWYPDAWEAIHGRSLQAGESHAKDRRNFERDHASDWVVISAIRSDQHPGMTECVATLGGNRRGPEQRRYLVPSDEYDPGRFGFVFDEARHRLYGGPSSFAGWR